MAAALLFLRGIPILVWPLALCFLGFMYERHEVHSLNEQIVVIKAQDANAKIKALQDAATESDRRIQALQGEVDASKSRAAASAASASAAGAAVASLSSTLSIVKRRLAAASHSTAASDIQATSQTALVCTQLLDVCEARSAERSQFADAANDAGIGCQSQYDSLRPPSTAAGPGIKR